MKKKVAKTILALLCVFLIIATIINIHKWITTGNQEIKITMPSQAYINSDLYISIIAQKNRTDLETRYKNKAIR